jgi:hypothetical protein
MASGAPMERAYTSVLSAVGSFKIFVASLWELASASVGVTSASASVNPMVPMILSSRPSPNDRGSVRGYSQPGAATVHRSADHGSPVAVNV